MNKTYCCTIEEAVDEILTRFPTDSLREIRLLSTDDLKVFQTKVSDETIGQLLSWLHNHTDLIEHCGSYCETEIAGFVIWELWKKLQSGESHTF